MRYALVDAGDNDPPSEGNRDAPLTAQLRVAFNMRGTTEPRATNMMRAPNIAVFVIAGCLAMIGVLSAMPIELPIPGLNQNNAAWYIFLGWFILSAGSVLPERSEAAGQA